MSAKGQRLIELVGGLLRATQAGKAQWRSTDLQHSYILATPSGAITLSKSTALASAPSYRLRIVDAAGQQIEDTVIGGLSGALLGIGTGDKPVTAQEEQRLEQLLASLFDAVDTSDVKADEVAAAILRDLGVG